MDIWCRHLKRFSNFTLNGRSSQMAYSLVDSNSIIKLDRMIRINLAGVIVCQFQLWKETILLCMQLGFSGRKTSLIHHLNRAKISLNQHFFRGIDVMVFYCTWLPQRLDNFPLFHPASSVGSVNKLYSPQQAFKSPTRKRGNIQISKSSVNSF